MLFYILHLYFIFEYIILIKKTKPDLVILMRFQFYINIPLKLQPDDGFMLSRNM